MMSSQEIADAATGHRLTITKLQPRIGAEIAGADLINLTDDARDLIYAALCRHRVLFFRDQKLSRAQHVELGRRFGELEPHPLHRHHIHPEVLPVKSKLGPLEEHGGSSGEKDDDQTANRWHTDLTCREAPPAVGILRGVQIPPLGGDTVWASAISAYEGLDDETKARIETLTATHDALVPFRRFVHDEAELANIRAIFPIQHHPIVRIHPDTGERMLFVSGAFVESIDGMDRAESRPLLLRLFAQFQRPEYQVRFSWTPDAIVFWDERATQHYAVQGFEGIDERLVERITTKGDVPFGPAAARRAA